MRPDSAIRIVVCMTLGLSAQAATITIDSEGSAPLVDQHGSYYSWLDRWSYLGGLYFEEPIDDGVFFGDVFFRLPPVEDVIGLRMHIYPLQRTIDCEWGCSAWGDSWLTSLRVEGPNGEEVNVPASSSSIDLLALGPEFFPNNDEETTYILSFQGAGNLSAPHPFYPLTGITDYFLASMQIDFPVKLTATLVVPEPRYYALA
jgi:hypothetical protein